MIDNENRISPVVYVGMLLLFSAILSLAWTGCGKDESTGPPLDSFIGEWEATTRDPPLQGVEYYIHTHTMVLSADSTFTYHRETHHGGATYHYNAAGTFSVQGNRLFLNYTEPDESVGEYTYEFTPTLVILTNVAIPSDIKEYELQ